jgi:hypothetical protein
MLKKSIMALAVAAVAVTSLALPGTASARGGIIISIGGLGHHHHRHHRHHLFVDPVFVDGDIGPSCYRYKRKFNRTGDLYWLRKYERCLDREF